MTPTPRELADVACNNWRKDLHAHWTLPMHVEHAIKEAISDQTAALQAALKDLAKANSALTSEQIAHGKTMRRFGAGTFSAGAGEPVVDELSRVEQFHEFLQGRLPDGVEVGHLPKLSADEAFTVIWFLQEVSEIISSSIEMCSYCGTLFDSDADGHIGEAGNYCSAMCEANDEREGIANEIESDHD